MFIHLKNHPNINIKCNNVFGYIPKDDEEPIQAELVFTTSMNGYIETFTDPSYYNQGLVFSYPSIGNYGIPEQRNFYTSEQHKKLVESGKGKHTFLPFLASNFESSKIQPSFIIVEKWIDLDDKLCEWFNKHKTPVLEVDKVREIVQLLRENGSQQVALLQNTILPETFQWVNFNEINYQDQVTTKCNYTYPGFVLEENSLDFDNNSYIDIKNDAPQTRPILFIDFGCKNAQLRELISRGINVMKVPWNYLLTCELTLEEITNLYSGMFLSSGPGDPRAEYIKPVIQKVKELIDFIIKDNDEDKYYDRFPIFGICFGHQVIGQALGYEITKLPYGHRGIHHPVRFSNNNSQHLGFITSQNHGYALKDIKKQLHNNFNVKPLFTHGFDGTNQGLKITNYNIYSVQFHPEACPGPKDTLWLFDYFNLVLNKYAWYTPIDFWMKYYNKTIDFTNISKLSDNTEKQKTILLIGSGGLQIGQAGEFDYSCSQAIKAYQSLGYRIVLLNPNVATIQTTLADQTYYLPLTEKYLTRVIKEQKPHYIAHSFGGQSALNLCINAYNLGMLSDIEILGTTPEDCEACEDREEFVNRLHLNKLSRYIIPSISLNENIPLLELHNQIIQSIQYPLLLRNSMALGGAGSCIIYSQQELEDYFKIHTEMSGIELCQSIIGWKEIEMEVMRDKYGNVCVICGMENLDPVGFHTGESVVVSPCQTLNDQILQECRTASILCAKVFNLIGEGNVQFAIHPTTYEIRIIEMNPRLSRSSALASKVTAYPIAAIAAQIQLGKSLLEIPNTNVAEVNGFQISAFYEPVLDYFAVKMPRWDINKLPELTNTLGTSMKSVGEVLSISRNYQQSLLNAMSATGNFTNEELEFTISKTELSNYYTTNRDTTKRWIAIMNLIKSNNLKEYLDIKIHPYFLQGFNLNINNSKIENYTYTNIDSFAGEIPTKSNYRYLTPLHKNYLDNISTSKSTLQKQKEEETPSTQYKGKVIIIGGGTYRIGSSVEFDWCCVSSARRARELGYYVVMINDNPETVSTDYTQCNTLYMENPNITNLKHIYTIETELCQQQGMEMLGVIVSMGGQTSNNLVQDCIENDIHIIGTQGYQIINAEDRSKFSELLDKLQIDQPEWINAKNLDEVLDFCDKVGYPTMVRPSFVLSGAGMRVIYNKDECVEFLKQAQNISGDHPVVVSKFIDNAKEIEVDAIVQNGDVRAMAISEHIEDAGTHSGDASIICPALDLTHETLKRVKAITHQLSIYLEISGPMNLQLLAKDDHLKVIELNLRASRSMPFVSRVYKFNFIEFATDIILDTVNIPQRREFNDEIEMIKVPKYLTSVKSRNLQTIGCKVPQFSFHRFPNMNQDLTVEMKSTGENGCYSKNKHKAYLRAITASGFKLPKSKYDGKLLLICNQKVKKELEKYLSMLIENNWSLVDYISLSNDNIDSNILLNDNSQKLSRYDLILYIKDRYLNISNEIEVELNKLRNVIRNKKQIKFMIKSICYSLDKI